MATLPGAPHPDESEPNTLPVEPEFTPVVPDRPVDDEPEPSDKPGRPAHPSGPHRHHRGAS